MSLTLYTHPYYSFRLLPGIPTILHFGWEEAHSSMRYEDFQEACHNYAGFAWEHRARHLLVDVRNFQLNLPAGFEAWREEALNPRYDRLGVRRFAYLALPEHLPFMPDVPGNAVRFETRAFADEAAAQAWLRS